VRRSQRAYVGVAGEGYVRVSRVDQLNQFITPKLEQDKIIYIYGFLQLNYKVQTSIYKTGGQKIHAV
jgi:hypothetical protein